MRRPIAPLAHTIVGLIGLVILGFLTVPLPSNAQEPGKVYRIGWLGPEDQDKAYFEPFLGQLHDLGWVEGQNFVMVYQLAPRQQFRKHVHALADELVRLNVDLIVTISTQAALAAKEATAAIPIVMADSSRPVHHGLIDSLARPGGNVTGLTSNPSNGGRLFGKMLQLLKEAAPGISRVGVLLNPSGPKALWPRRKERMFAWWQMTAQRLGLTALPAMVTDPHEYTGAFAMFTQERADAMFVTSTPLNIANRKRIVDFATTQRLPMMTNSMLTLKAGGLMFYWTNRSDLKRRSAIYVDKILKGSKPAALPVEEPIKFDFIINLKTAKALGLTIPSLLLFQADKVIE